MAPEHLEKAKYHFFRVSALVTGENEINSEGLPVAAWRLPEARTPVRFVKNGQIQEVFLVSPNSPLNWSTAEYILALQWLSKAVHQSEQQDASSMSIQSR